MSTDKPGSISYWSSVTTVSSIAEREQRAAACGASSRHIAGIVLVKAIVKRYNRQRYRPRTSPKAAPRRRICQLFRLWAKSKIFASAKSVLRAPAERPFIDRWYTKAGHATGIATLDCLPFHRTEIDSIRFRSRDHRQSQVADEDCRELPPPVLPDQRPGCIASGLTERNDSAFLPDG